MGARITYYIGRAVTLLFMVLGGFVSLVLLLVPSLDEMGWLAFAVSTGFFVIGLVQWTTQSYRAKRNYAWYKTQHPECVGDKVKCHSCGSDRITLQMLLQHSYTRAHVCAKCGTTLFYSPEA